MQSFEFEASFSYMLKNCPNVLQLLHIDISMIRVDIIKMTKIYFLFHNARIVITRIQHSTPASTLQEMLLVRDTDERPYLEGLPSYKHFQHPQSWQRSHVCSEAACGAWRLDKMHFLQLKEMSQLNSEEQLPKRLQAPHRKDTGFSKKNPCSQRLHASRQV